MAELAPDLEAGSTHSGYRFERLLGRGGMGAVYEAEQLSLQRRVAVKVISAELSSSESFRARFADEARAAASLEHAHVLPVHETGELPDGRLFIAMRLVRGTDLGTRLRTDGPLAPQQAMDVLTQLGGALDAAHEAGLIHRDVKPGNVLLADNTAGPPHVWLSDFGLAKRVDSAPRHTETGELLGTVDYMAPEQIDGADLTSRVDVYAFGCLAYRCLTGDVPFRRDTRAAVLVAHSNAPAPRPSDAVAGIPPALDTLVARAMEKDPAKRAASAGALARWAARQLDANQQPARADADWAETEPLMRRSTRLSPAVLVGHLVVYAPVWAGAYLVGRSF